MRSVEKARWQDNDLACVRPQSALTFLKYAAMRMGGAVVSVCGSEGGIHPLVAQWIDVVAGTAVPIEQIADLLAIQ
jgi:hypothetical protein